MNDPIKKAVVTGAKGFIGSQLCSHLLHSGYFVRALLRSATDSSSTRLKNLIAPHSANAELVVADICDAESLTSVFDGIDTVFHLAGVAHVNNVDSEAMRWLNVEGSRNVLRAAVASRVRRLVFVSSSLAQACELDAGDVTDYGQTKLEAEQLLLAAHRSQDIEVAILRAVNVYGIGMKGNISAMISMIARGQLPPLPRLENRLSLVGVDDLARAAVLAAENMVAGGKIYYVTDGESYLINGIEQAIYQALGRKLPGWKSPRVLLYVASALAGLLGKMTGRGSSIGTRTYYNLVRNNCFSNQEISSDLGFVPASNLYDELPVIVAQIVAQLHGQAK